MPDVTAPDDDYAHLSLKDLLAARELYHVHLMRHPNVVATALGRYRIRKTEPWPSSRHPHAQTKRTRARGARTLENSEVRPYSWPAILVFVSEWLDAHAFRTGGEYDPDEIVPRTIYLPDGRRVPVCVVEAPRLERTPATAPPVRYPLNNIGGGFPVLARVQGREYVATIGCLVTDGHKYYGLTNRHVTGDAGEVIYSELDGTVRPIGRSAGAQLTRLPFDTVYPGWSSPHTFVNLDIGLIDADDITSWTTDVRGIGAIGPLVDLSSDNLTLSLIGAEVRGCGAAGGVMRGEVHALFYRYKSRAGVEYVADFFIGPRTTHPAGAGRSSRRRAPAPFATFPGDSGTLWLLDAPGQAPCPLALQWGENLLQTGAAAAQPYVLATCLSTVCDQLSIDLVRDWNVDQPDTWGAVGHFSIAARAIGALSSRVPKLAKLMTNNLTIISHDDQTILTSGFKGMGAAAFVPMADVPDFFWKHGTQGSSRPLEGPNHFADMDQTRDADGLDLLALCKKPGNIDPTVWNTFYDAVRDLLTGDPVQQVHRGLLPFRVWQIFDQMVGFAAAGKTAQFVCAAGVLAHYVGDACQPLHISYLHDGDPQRAQSKTVHHKNGTVETVNTALGVGVHSAYEDEMVNAHRQDILDGLAKTKKVLKADLINNGVAAAAATVALMRATFTRIPPAAIVAAFVAYTGAKKDRADAFWKQFGAGTLKCMQDGTHLVARLWQSAWTTGTGESTAGSTAALTPKAAMRIVADRQFLPSMSIAHIGSVLKRPGADA